MHCPCRICAFGLCSKCTTQSSTDSCAPPCFWEHSNKACFDTSSLSEHVKSYKNSLPRRVYTLERNCKNHHSCKQKKYGAVLAARRPSQISSVLNRTLLSFTSSASLWSAEGDTLPNLFPPFPPLLVPCAPPPLTGTFGDLLRLRRPGALLALCIRRFARANLPKANRAPNRGSKNFPARSSGLLLF